uniref:Carboxypeptidase n=1 Tax=Paramoeba aestuarina TaxID=180227 RepID=A0A7S4NTA5_9EUKA|mmetsp:Transcript_2724/g.4220  ORF Transcript_2724/g.4220 Transcript_2724/m.4220 type:complete len:501 (+) Transcript_2724:48-1550(+)|eukprot:CAMPEP_0201522300 /NCGR_PEP_ID=MMETSP0161_2-20130828/16812_1 /ASSEMBLY_ACC=CAM_ASM_000251 /TAXON_ID=180227 /ORGANISM="Neoparamoeba aestuarina, Strain SoJaBio B1-5/56/2" /LENGTH=500 /DNA_ID=CAMNT_0047921103 /DNA_START=42 /DNA_END=1544 /DNA_ORIENTATION=+
MLSKLSFCLLLISVWGIRGDDDCDFCGPFPVTADTLPSYIGPNPFPFETSTGYVVVNEEFQRNNFYWLTESSSPNPDQDPLVFWFTGGPGCSGIDALFSENGPFTVLANGSVVLKDITWNSFANVVYLEQPCGVGFSYSSDPDYNYNTNDTQTAGDNFNFIEGFLQANPKFLGRPTWLSGESYGGIYIPTLAEEIIKHTNSDIYKQFVGTTNGNPAVVYDDLFVHYNTNINIYFWNQLISQEAIDNWNAEGCYNHEYTPTCSKIYQDAVRQHGPTYQEDGPFHFNGTQPSLDPDDLYQDFIVGNGTLRWSESLNEGLPSSDEAIEDYLSRSDVQAALHAHAPVQGSWEICGFPGNYIPTAGSMIPYYESLFSLRPDVHVLIYSGDVDIATVPGPITTKALLPLNSTIKTEWAPWYVNGATVGYVQYYDTYAYATVKGAGHEGPAYQPLSSHNMIERFYTKQSLDGGEIYTDSASKPVSRRRALRQGDMLRKLAREMGQKF